MSTSRARAPRSKSPRPAGKKPKAGGKASNPSSLRVRMYRVGFGDFFLVTVPSSDGPQHILIDCGVTKGKTGKGDIASIKSAVRHMAAETGSKLALIIVTHRHQDHIVGFSRCQAEFEKFEVKAIWMPYWETEYKDEVRGFQAGLEGLAFDLKAAALAATPDENTAEILGIIENATGVSKEGPGGGSNAKSLELLKHKLGVKPEYYYKGQTPKLPSGLVSAGLAAHVLGPPPPDELAFLKLMDLRKGVGQYLGGPDASSGQRTKVLPFGQQYVVGADAYPANAFREWAPRSPDKPADYTRRYAAELERAVKSSTPTGMLTAARTLDSMLNNQSLVVLFTWNDKKLLFAGDAQAGNWEYWLYDLDKPTSNPGDAKLAKASADILDSIDFYKVGHHGSTNATPISAVKAMAKGFVAMCSTQHDTFGNPDRNTEVPRAPLLEALAEKSALVCSDQIAVTVDGTTIPAADDSPSRLPRPKSGKLVKGDCYIDYLL